MTPTLELIETKTLKHHKNPRVTLQGYLYVLQKRCRLYCRWKCNRLLTFRCPCVLKTSLDLNNMQVMGMDHEHNHPDDLEAIHNLKFKLVFNDKVGNQKTWFKSMYPIKERENFKRFVPEEIKNNTIAPIQFIKTKEDFNVSSIYESPENINRDRNYIDSQMNKFKQIYSRKEIHNIDHHHNTNKYNEKIEESTVTDNHTNFSNLGSANNTYSSILRSILTSSKNNRVGIPYYVFPPNENYYARILKINLQKNNITNLSINNKDLFSNTQIETIILETSNQINTNIKHNTSDINFINNNCKRIYVEDDDNFINNNSKKICLSKIHCINSQVEITDISIHDDGKNIHVHKNQDIYTQVEYTDISINDDKIFHNNNDTNNIYIYKTNTTIDDDRKINDGIDKDKNTKVEDTSISINDDKIVHNNNGINNTYINETNTSIDDDKKMNDGIDKVKNTKVEDTSISINYDKIVHNNNGINNTYINETNTSIDDDKKMNDGIDKDKNTKVEDTGISINDDKIVHNNNDTNNTYINETNTSIDNKKIKNGIDKDKNTKVEDTGISINDDKIVLNNNDTNNTYINETNTSINDGIDKYKNTKVEDTGISINDDKIVHNNNDTNNIYINKTNISIDNDKKIKNGIDKDKNTKLEDTGIYINDDKIVYNNNGINNTYINETNTFIDNKKINDGIDKDKNTKVEDTGISINDDKIVQNNNDTNNTYINETNTSIDDGKKINDGIDKDKNTKVEDTGISINDDKIVHNNNDTNNTYINETNTSIDDDKKIKNGIDKDKNTKVEDTGISINDDKIVLNNNDTNNTYINETNTSINDGIDKYKNTKVEDTDISIDVEKKVHVDDEENSTKEVGNIISTLKNDLNSKNMDNIIKNLNNSKTGKKVFNSLVQMKFISLLVHSTSFRKKLTKFKTNKFLWKRKFDKLILDMNQMGNICKRIVNMKNYSPKCEKLQLRNVGVQVDIKEEMKEELSRPFFNQDNNSKLVPNVIHIDLTDSGNEPLDYQKANITQSNTSGLINSGIICLDIPSSQIITDVTKNIKSNVLNSNIIPKSKTLPDVSLTVPNQNVSEEKIENNYTLSTKIPLKKSKSIPNAAVLRMKPKKELKKISFATEISFKNVQNLSNTKKLNSKFSYTFTANEKLKNISNILTPNKTSLPDVVQSTQILKNVCHSHEMCTCNSNDQKDLSFSPKSVHFTILCQELIRFRSTETQGPFLENLNDVEKRLHPPMLETTVSKLYDYNPPSAVLTWEFGSNFRCSQIIKNVKSYEVAMISILNNNNELTCDGWEQIGLVKALQLPMACTVQLDKDCRRTYYFAVRAQDTKQRWGPFNVSSGLIF